MSRFPSYPTGSHGGPPEYSSNLTSRTLSNGATPNMHALIIGINEYADSGNYPKLHGCVKDGESVREYLVSRLAVPQKNIHCLYNSDATHTAILREIECFGSGYPRRGKAGDAILIYYAGHGGEGPPPSQSWGYRPNEKIQVLIPYDCGNRGGVEICAIPDYIIDGLLKNIADRIGRNITVIFDCCHSASLTRSGDFSADSDSAIRGVKYRGRLPSLPIFDHPSSSTRTRGVQVAAGYNNGAGKSHILLAACQSHESAREEQKRGVFTIALLDALYKMDMNEMRSLTYREFLKRIPQLHDQNPQCEGDFQDRFLFQLTESKKTEPLLSGRVSGTGGTLRIQGGQANGMNKDDDLAIWQSSDDHARGIPPVGRAIITAIWPYKSEARTKSHWPLDSQFVCKVVVSQHTPDLLVYVPSGDRVMSVVKNAIDCVADAADPHMAKFKYAPLDIARVSFRFDAQEQLYYLQLNEAAMNRRGLATIPHSIPANANTRHFCKVLHGIAVYEYYLRHVERAKLKFSELFSLELSRLDRDGRTGELREQTLKLNPTTGFDIVEDNSSFMIKIVNETDYSFYPALFYFDNCDFSIQCLFQPPSAGNHVVNPPLKPRQSLTIGGGTQGRAPFEVCVRRPRTLETGYLKLFISSTYMEFNHIEHRSPFNPSTTRAPVPYVHKKLDIFGSLMIPFVVRRSQRMQEYGSRVRGVYQNRTPVPFDDRNAWGTVFRTSSGAAPSSHTVDELSEQVQETERTLKEMESVIPQLQDRRVQSAAQLQQLWKDLERMETAVSQY